MFISELEKKLTEIKNMYISSCDYWHITSQSCDCQKIIVDTGDRLILFKHTKFEDTGCITFDEISDFDKEEFIYKVDFDDETFKFNGVEHLDNGFIDGIEFVNDAFLYIFSSEYNLILSKSKYSMFDDSTDCFEDEGKITLDISKIEHTDKHKIL